MSTKDKSAQAWTPGKWEALDDEDREEIEIGVRRKVGIRLIATVDYGFVDELKRQQMANARLIAAAPLLYEALELALKGLEVAAETSPERDDEAWFGYVLAHQKARAALAAARGEQA